MSHSRMIKAEAASLLSSFTDSYSIKEAGISEVKLSDIHNALRSNQFILAILSKKISEIQDKLDMLNEKSELINPETSSPKGEIDELIKRFENLEASDERVTQKLDSITQKVGEIQATPSKEPIQPNFGWTRKSADIMFLWKCGQE